MDEYYFHIFSSYYHEKGINFLGKLKKSPPYSPPLKKLVKIMTIKNPITNYNYRVSSVRPQGIEP